METNRTTWHEFYELLNMTEDYLSTGYRGVHAAFVLPHGDSTEALNAAIAACTRCGLHKERGQVVCGTGSPGSRLMVIGDVPDSQEEAGGVPFAGACGEYLEKWLTAIQLDRKVNVFLCNLVKCRPRDDRKPAPDEVQACLPFLERQIRLITPTAILCAGLVASRVLTGQEGQDLESLRSRVHTYGGIPVIATYHPRAVLMDPLLRAPVWTDLKLLRTQIG